MISTRGVSICDVVEPIARRACIVWVRVQVRVGLTMRVGVGFRSRIMDSSHIL